MIAKQPHSRYCRLVRVIGYVRVSRVAGREGDSFISPSDQRARIERFAAAHDHVVVGWEEDLDQPGSRYERPGFQATLAAVEAGQADGVAVAALDRFARSVPDAAVALRRLESAGGTLMSVRDSLDTSTPIGRFARTMMLALAELELERIRENWSVARDRAIGRGVHISRVPPAGYRRQSDGRLEPDPVAAPVIRELFLRRAAGASWRELCDFLDERLPREQGSWTHQTVSSIVRRRAYLGEAHQGAVVNKDAHEPLVSRSEWEAAQSRPAAARGKKGALLAGLIRCSGCGCVMSRAADGARGYENYRCYGRHSAGLCPTPARISLARADDYVTAAFLDWVERQRIAVESSPRADAVETAVLRAESAEEELVIYRDANLISIIGQEAYVAGLAERQRTLDQARAQLDDARRTTLSLPTQDVPGLWANATTAERRAFLAAAIDAVVVSRATRPGRAAFHERIGILWRGQAPVDLPGRRHAKLVPLPVPTADERPDVIRVPRTHNRQ
jgi:DNA invertase Pin-like site-specific DNA recombinase